MANYIITPDWDSESVDKHRRGICDAEWAKMQKYGEPEYFIGDVVKFKVGGWGVINEVAPAHDGWPASYSAAEIKGKPFHSKGKVAWHYEGDMELVKPSPLRRMEDTEGGGG